MKVRKRNAAAPEKHATTLEQEMDEDSMPERFVKKKTEKIRIRQDNEDFVDAKISSRILKEARSQQVEEELERVEGVGTQAGRDLFAGAAKDVVSGNKNRVEDESDDDGGEFEETAHFSDTESQYEELEMAEVTEEEERAVAAFMARDAGPQKTLADMIMAKIKERGQEAGIHEEENEERTVPGLDSKVCEVYRGVGQLLQRYSAGKIPKAFKILPALSNWEEVLYLTSPEQWSPLAMFAATRLFASNLNARMAQRFFHLVLLPRVRQDIRQHKRLHFALYQSLKKALYKPSAFYKGFLLPLCQSRTCNLREAFIVGSALQKVSVPVLHSRLIELLLVFKHLVSLLLSSHLSPSPLLYPSVAMMKIAQMEYSGTNSYFLKLLLDKKYALPYRVLDAVLEHFLRFAQEDRDLPVIWHQSLLTFVQRYKNELRLEDQDRLRKLVRQRKHYLMTPEILRELSSCSVRGKGTGSVASGSGTAVVSVLKAVIEEDFRDMPDVTDMMDTV